MITTANNLKMEEGSLPGQDRSSHADARIGLGLWAVLWSGSGIRSIFFTADSSFHRSDADGLLKAGSFHSLVHEIKAETGCIRSSSTRSKCPVKVKGAVAKHDNSSISAPWWKGVRRRGQIFLHRSKAVLFGPDLPYGKVTELIKKTMFRIEGTVKAGFERPASALIDGQECLWLVELLKIIECASGKQRLSIAKTTLDLSKTKVAEVIEANLAERDDLQTGSRL